MATSTPTPLIVATMSTPIDNDRSVRIIAEQNVDGTIAVRLRLQERHTAGGWDAAVVFGELIVRPHALRELARAIDGVATQLGIRR